MLFSVVVVLLSCPVLVSFNAKNKSEEDAKQQIKTAWQNEYMSG